MQFLLATLNVAYVLTKPSPKESENETLVESRECLKFGNDDFICRGHIFNAMLDLLFNVYQNYPTAKELWKALEGRYFTKDATNVKKNLKHHKDDLSMKDLGKHLLIEEQYYLENKANDDTSKKTMKYYFEYNEDPSVLEGYTNASWITDQEEYASISRWVFTLGGGAVSWGSKKQSCLRNSTKDETIDVDTIGNEDKKHKIKAPSNPRKPKAESVFKADSHRHGTRHLNNHYPNCDANPDVEKIKKQKKLAFKKKISENDEGGTNNGTLETWKYDEKVIKESLIKLIVLAELPFKFVEHPAFIKFSSDMQPRFNMPSCFKIVRDISKFYLEERKSLFNFLSKDSTTVHLTTDTWTSSCKRMNFMVLTAHFIDDDWVMHKRIINFRPIHSHRGVDIGRALLECITGWGIKNVMTVTVDNIASNDKALEYLVENLPTKYDNVFENATDSKKFLISECHTRWNSTHDMLNTAIELKDAFFDYDFNNSCFARDLEETPKRADFEKCRKVVQFLEKFKGTTELVSNVSSPVAHLWFGETPFQLLTPDELCAKFVEKIEKVEKAMGLLFSIYKEKYGTSTSSDLPRSMSNKSTSSRSRRGNAFINSFKDKVGNKLSGCEDELKKYLKEPRLELEDDEDFDILTWWKINSPRFPIVSRMAKDILCIQVSTVASESAFSASGRVLDPYRNSLAPNIVEALVCTQDWIRTSSRNITMDTLEDLMKDDELAKEIQEGLDKQKGEQTQGKEKNVEA
ncbi:zinc finger BED domain-containing protein RICESLEEPER 2 [Tanacetum coccineum]